MRDKDDMNAEKYGAQRLVIKHQANQKIPSIEDLKNESATPSIRSMPLSY